MADKKTEEIKIAELIEVTTQTAPAIKLPDGNIVNELQLLVLIYNKLLKIEGVLI